MKIKSIVTKFLKIFLFIIISVNSILSLNAQTIKNKFELNGKILGQDTGMIYLGYYINKEQKVVNDSSRIYNGRFSFRGTLYEPAVGFIRLNRQGIVDMNWTNIFLEPSSMNISVEINRFSQAHLTGSKSQMEYEELRTQSNPIKEKYSISMAQLRDEQFLGNKDSLKALLETYYDSWKQLDYSFFLSHPKSYVTAYLLQSRIRDLPIDSLVFFYSRLGYELQKNIVSNRILEKISQIKAGSIGSIAKSFNALDVNGNYVISDFFKGKYVLLDFWASWCVPCRAENPRLISLYNKYKGKGLTIIGIADNTGDTSAWKKAIQTDGIGMWTHILRGLSKEAKAKGLPNSNDISEKFGVGVLPTFILINPEGVIKGRYEEINELEKSLASIFH